MYRRRFQGCAIEDSGPSGFGSSFLVAGVNYCSNGMCRRYGCLLDSVMYSAKPLNKQCLGRFDKHH